MNSRKQYYPSFLQQFRDKPFDTQTLSDAYFAARIGGNVRGSEEINEYFREYRIDAAHWNYHQRILHDEVLFRLISEGYIHPKVHPVGGIYGDPEFYSFVFPFIHTAVMKKMADAVRSANLEQVKLLEQWIEPFGTLFRDAFYRLIEFTAEELLKELVEVKLNRKTLPFDVYGRISPVMMHLLNRLPPRLQNFRDRFGIEIMEFAIWQRNEMKVYAQPAGMLTRLKLLQVSNDIHAQRNIQLTQWENEKEVANKEKFNMNHLLWIIPAVLIVAFIAWRQTDIGKSSDALLEEKQEQAYIEQKVLDEKMFKISKRMENIDLNELIAEELYTISQTKIMSGDPMDPVKDPNRPDNGALLYKEWLSPGREVYPTQRASLFVHNDSECDLIIFLRQEEAPFMERALYVRAGKQMVVHDQSQRDYTMRIYAGSGWCDSLVATNYDQKLFNAGVPEEVKEQFPATTELRGRFIYPAEMLQQNLQPVNTKDSMNYFDGDGVPVITIGGNREKIEFVQQKVEVEPN